ncbi:LOW QUALITY PROTEIN: protein FATTY ACID EXPORT 2, chloroplastic-like [Diospyros lotus]|uniref:LOW QUALITY PROTEIN: protein FATTY ACID EXPORT 2, chloroplastic-like n=1 Tax=Diospyros lotus TaxID=55363 RepID=UPI00224FFE83|nr:LOW QUALITY PROTEIN: protein FATTY ACID EXPORT 2, chloroplastic-like [Diospyros lotus]
MGELLPLSHCLTPHRQLRFHDPTDRTGSCSALRSRISRRTGTVRVVSDSKPPTLIFESAGGKEIDIEPDSSGNDGGLGGGRGGEGGGGGGGGGGGDDSNIDGPEGGSSEGHSGKQKMSMSLSQKLTLGYAALVGVGGAMGYLKSGSRKSLMSGGLSALLLYYVYTELPARPTFASSIGFGLSAALLGVMGSRFKKSGKIFPAGVVSIVSLVMSGGYLHGILRGMH